MLSRLLLIIVFSLTLAGGAWAHSSIVRSDDGRELEVCLNSDSPTNAIACATNKCRGKCNPVAAFKHECIAYVIDRETRRYYFRKDEDPDIARVKAITACGDFGGEACTLYINTCDTSRK